MIERNERLIIVTGMAHSGTTILTYVLKQHPEVVCAVNGNEAWILENDWLPCEQTQLIQDLLAAYPFKRLRLKRPWTSAYHADFLVNEMPNARYIYCWRNFIAISWSKPTSLVEDRLRRGGVNFQLHTYQECLAIADVFGKRVPYFRKLFHPGFVGEPVQTMSTTAEWLWLVPFQFDVSEVSLTRDIKKVLCGGSWDQNGTASNGLHPIAG